MSTIPPGHLDAPHTAETVEDKSRSHVRGVPTKPTKPHPAIEWGQPRELEPVLRPVPVLRSELLPTPLQPWIEDSVERMSCPLEYMAVSALCALGTTIGRRVQVRPRQHDDWTVTANLWGAVIGDSGTMKSSPASEGLKPLQALHDQACARFAREQAAHRARQEVQQAVEKGLKKAIADAVKDKQSTDALESELAALLASVQVNHRQRFLVRDATTQKVGILAAENPMGLMLYRDELSGWIASLHKKNNEGDRQFYLEGWKGNLPFSYERVGRPDIDIPALCVSICGTIQPEPFFDVIQNQARYNGAGDGLVQRFQLLLYPDRPERWRCIDRRPNQEARQVAFQIYQRIADYNFGSKNRTERPFLRFSGDGLECFKDWEGRHRNRVLSSYAHPALIAHFGKYPKCVVALALMSHLADWAAGDESHPSPIGLEHCQRAIRWADILEAHACRIYGRALGPNLKAVHSLATRLRTGALQDRFTVREVSRKGWAGICNADRAQEALDYLEERLWVRGLSAQPGPKGGRPTRRYFINPAIARADA